MTLTHCYVCGQPVQPVDAVIDLDVLVKHAHCPEPEPDVCPQCERSDDCECDVGIVW